ncbi:type II secretion system F family protein [Methylocapsa sp. D3K7]|uniref:type II secretion system F family protein n=1 Tax=Methylocapsa sp. D3K7 TaxID=3041435 RepID=UPI00244ED35C|nr:type II secretion system F family protein [Methylocapsa sp. D3K7]WGJ16397.1 type II secretion system F family protein [Methylocapsa sp. D3K7]
MQSVAVLALVLLLFGVFVLTAALMMSRGRRLEMERRLNLVAGIRETLVTAETLGGLLKVRSKEFDVKVRRIFTIGIKRTWAMQINSLTLLLVAALSAGGVWILTYHFFDLSLLLSTVVSLFASFIVPRFILSRQQKRTERKFIDLFPEAVDTVARMVRAGLPITAAMRTIAVDALPPVNTVFATIADQLRIGVPIEDTLDSSSREIGLPDFRFFTVAVALQYATGGNLSTTLDILSDIIRKRRATRLKAKAATGEIRITAYTLGGIPVLTIGALLVIQPGYLTPLFTDPRGHLIIGMACAAMMLAFLSMRMMMRSVTDG